MLVLSTPTGQIRIFGTNSVLIAQGFNSVLKVILDSSNELCVYYYMNYGLNCKPNT